jgi:predicted hotdog family 3-hydroxylacyl-ACP dehydratase
VDLETIDIAELLPQKAPFVMVDALTYLDETTTRTRLKVRADNILVENDELTESGVIENIAQSCATRMGYRSRYICSDEVKIGFIGAVNNLVINNLPKVGEELQTTIEIANEVFNITLVKAKVEVDGKLTASCEMKISLTDKET